jgi:CubicO group peptidase (beta-lactamase class C family)
MREPRSFGSGLACGLAVVLLCAGCDGRASLARSRTKKVEKGLLRAVVIKGTKAGRAPLGERMEFYKVPGVSVAVLDRYGVEWAKAYGIRDVRTCAPVMPDTLFQAGALGQPVAAAAVLSLVERGTLDLDADASKALRSWKPSFPGTAPGEVPALTLRKLLSHASGLGGQVFDGFLRKSPMPSLAQVLEGQPPAANRPILEGLRPSIVGGSESGYVVVQQLIADATGEPFPSFAGETVLAPLGMTNSTFEVPLPASLESRAASGHLRPGPPVEGGWLDYPESAAKGLWTTPLDYANFLLALVGDAMGRPKRLLSPESARMALTPQFGNSGFGVLIEGSGSDVRFSVRGRTSGFSALAVFYPARGQGLVVMTNSDNGGLLADEFLRGLSAAYGWPDYKPEEKPLFRLDPSTYAQYIGRYEISPDYALDVSFEDYYLVIQPTGQARTKFYVESETIFFSVDPYIRVQFRRNDRGVVDGLVLWQEDFEQKAVKVQ